MSDTTNDTPNTDAGEVRDDTKNLLPESERAEPSEAVQEGLDTAKVNAKAEEKVNGKHEGAASNEAIEDAQETAKINAAAEKDAQVDGHTIAKNDTSKAGKVRTAKSQLDPTGEDDISDAEIARSATDGVKVKGGTNLSNEEVAERAKTPGKAEEENGFSVADEGVDDDKKVATEDSTHANGNENEHTGQGGIADQAGTSNAS